MIRLLPFVLDISAVGAGLAAIAWHSLPEVLVCGLLLWAADTLERAASLEERE